MPRGSRGPARPCAEAAASSAAASGCCQTGVAPGRMQLGEERRERPLPLPPPSLAAAASGPGVLQDEKPPGGEGQSGRRGQAREPPLGPGNEQASAPEEAGGERRRPAADPHALRGPSATPARVRATPRLPPPPRPHVCGRGPVPVPVPGSAPPGRPLPGGRLLPWRRAGRGARGGRLPSASARGRKGWRGAAGPEGGGWPGVALRKEAAPEAPRGRLGRHSPGGCSALLWQARLRGRGLSRRASPQKGPRGQAGAGAGLGLAPRGDLLASVTTRSLVE